METLAFVSLQYCPNHLITKAFLYAIFVLFYFFKFIFTKHFHCYYCITSIILYSLFILVFVIKGNNNKDGGKQYGIKNENISFKISINNLEKSYIAIQCWNEVSFIFSQHKSKFQLWSELISGLLYLWK